MSRLLIIGFIWLGCTLAWSILGSSLTIRSADTSSARGEEVYGLWGGPLYQEPPQAFDHLALTWAIILSAVVSMALVLSYVRLFVGWRFALERVAPVQLICLVLFSATFFWKGFTGLSITVGAILTLFAVMQLTGRLDWTETFAKRTARRGPVAG